MPTIRDVAKLAGVAPITVSRVINQSGYFTEETRNRVQEAIDQLGYVPNKLARSLRLRQTSMLALVLTDITNPFWTTVARGVEDAASDASFNVILCNTDESESEEEQYLKVLLERQVDGILLVPAQNYSEPVRLIQKQNVPVVILDRHLPGSLTADIVRGDSYNGAYQLTQHLLSLGHKQITMLAGPREVSTAEDRVTGFQQALEDAGLGNTGRIIYGEFTLESGLENAQAALAESPCPTAIFACNNFLAIGALKAIHQEGLTVPGDLSLVAFDDLPSALVWDPFLTVASQPAYDMGYQATQILLERLSNHHSDHFREIVLPVEIIIRKSTGPVHPS